MCFLFERGKRFFGVGMAVVCFIVFGGGAACSFEHGSTGEADDPYRIETLDHLNQVRNNLSAHYILMNDIDASDTEHWNEGEGWKPIGALGASFTGTFDGNGYEISGLFIDRESTSGIGLFGFVGGTVKNVGLIDVDITGDSNVGGLVGFCSGMISDSYSTGSVTGDGHSVGGLAGSLQPGTITDSYALGVVNGDGSVGGLVGSIAFGGTITNSYAVGGVNGVSNAGGLVGFFGIDDGLITDSFWDVDEDGIEGTESGSCNLGATGKTTAEMQTKSTFTDTGWDFDDIWDINALNDGYPFLRWQVSPDPDPDPVPEPGPDPQPDDDDDADAPRRSPSPSPAPEPEPAHPAPPAGFKVEPRDGFILSNHIAWIEGESGAVSSYRLYVSMGGSTGAMEEGGAEGFEFWLLGEFSSDTFEYTHTGLSGVRYYYIITSVNEEGLESNVTSPVYWANPATGEYGWLDALAWPGNIVENPEDGSSSCFIATAAYGSAMSSEVMSLRKFRDGFLLSNGAGSRLVEAYYSASPVFADVLAESGILRKVARMHLAPFAGFAGFLTNVN